MGGDDGALQDVVLVRDIADGLEQQSDILNESKQAPEGQPVADYPVTAEPDDQRNTGCADQIDERKKDCVIKDRVDVGLAVFVVDFIKATPRDRKSVV